MRNKILAVIVICGVALLAALFWLSAQKSEFPINLAVVFLGTTNFSGTNLALFKISNTNHLSVKRWDIYQIQLQSSNSFADCESSSKEKVLRPGESETVALLVPSHQGSWRAAFLCSPATMRTKYMELATMLKALITGSANYAYPMENCYSTWIEL